MDTCRGCQGDYLDDSGVDLPAGRAIAASWWKLLEPFRRDSSGRAFLERLRAQWEAAKTRYD